MACIFHNKPCVFFQVMKRVFLCPEKIVSEDKEEGFLKRFEC